MSDITRLLHRVREGERAATQPQIADRAHFLALMSRVMRQVLIDHARASAAGKRGGGDARVPWDTNIEVRSDDRAEQLKLLDLHQALEALERENAALAVIEMHPCISCET